MKDTKEYLSEKYPHISFHKSWDLTEKTVFQLGECSAIVKSLEYLPLDPAVRQKLLNVSLIKGAQATTAIEGNTLSEDEVLAISNGEKLPESRKYLEIEVKNVLDALNVIFSEVVEKNQTAYVSPDLICKFHQLIGKDLGVHFESIPGRFRENNVAVGTYRAPDYSYVPQLMRNLSAWLKEEFAFKHDEEQDFAEFILESIVTHVYIAWIHPFGDGNGRTARLMEFYLLLRSGMPNICSHILSNHYNLTRNEYYRQLEQAGKTRNLTEFIKYAIQGFLDGLNEVLLDVQRHQISNAWKNYVYEFFDDASRKMNEPKKKRLRSIVLSMDFPKDYSLTGIQQINIDIAATYKNLSDRTINRDIEELIEMELLVQADEKYSANIGKLVGGFAKRRRVSTLNEPNGSSS